MTKSPRRFPSPGPVIATIALFAVLASTAWAATLPRNSVSTKSIKKNAVNSSKVRNNSLTGADVRNNSLSGADIDESTLAKVPQADTVDGVDISGLVSKDNFFTFNVGMNRGEGDRTVATIGPFALKSSCFSNGPTSFDLRTTLTTANNDGWGYVDGVLDTFISTLETKYVNNQTAVTPSSQIRDVGALDLFDRTSGVATQGTVYAYGGFQGANCRYVGVFTVERP